MDQLQPASGVNEDSFRDSMRSPTMLSKSLEPVRATKVHLYRNGDAFFPARQVVIRRGDMNLDRVLDYMSGEMKDYGAIRRLYTPKNGTRVTEVSQIQDGSTLVVSKTNRFRKIPYSSILNIRDREARFKTYQANRPAIKLRSPVKVLPRRFFFGTEKPKNVVFMRNGDKNAKPHRVLLTKRNTHSWDQLCQILSDKLKMESAVKRIYTVSGELITGFDQIEDGASYVAVARIKFKNLGYKPAPPMKLSSPRKIPLPPISKAKVRIRPRPPPKLPGNSPSPRKVPVRNRPKPTVIESPDKPTVIVSPERQRTPPMKPTPEPTPEPPNEPTPEPTPEPPNEPTPEPTPELTPEPPKESSPVSEPEPEPEPEQIEVEVTAAEVVAPVVKVQSFLLKVWTADVEGAGTDAKVFMTIYGSKGSSPRLPLSGTAGRFDQGATDLIPIEADAIGKLQRIRIEHDNSGPSSAWKLSKITVRDTVSDKLYYFHCNRWIADDRCDFQTVAELEASDSDLEPEPESEAAPAVAVDETGFAATETRETADDVKDSAETKVDEVEDVDAKAEEVDEVAPEAEIRSPEPELEATVVVEKDGDEAGETDEIEEIEELEEAEAVNDADETEVQGASSDADDANTDEGDGVEDEVDVVEEVQGASSDADDADADEGDGVENEIDVVEEVQDASSDADDADADADEGDGAEDKVDVVEEADEAGDIQDASSDVESESVASEPDTVDAELVASDAEVAADGKDEEPAADASPAINGLSDAEEQLRVAITDVQHGDLRGCFSAADDGTNVASLTELAKAISNKVPELTRIEDLQAGMPGAPSDGEGPTVTGFEEAQLLLASAFYVKRCKEHLEPNSDNEYTLDLDSFMSTVKHFGVFTLSDGIVTDFEGLGKDEAGKVSVLEVGMWLANHRIIPLLT